MTQNKYGIPIKGKNTSIKYFAVEFSPIASNKSQYAAAKRKQRICTNFGVFFEYLIL
jgi:hypothetical protein